MKHDVNILSLIRFWLAYPLFRLSGAIGGQFFRRVMVESPQAFVLTVPVRASAEMCDAIRKQWKSLFANSPTCRDVPLVILTAGTTLQVVDMKDQSRAGCRDHLGE